MGKTQIIIFLILFALMLGLFIAGLFIFIFQYRKKKVSYDKEKKEADRQHKLDILNTQLESQQQTMQHIGREIHDNVGQRLTLASLYIKQVKSIDVKIEQAGEIIDQSLKELRQLSKSLVNPSYNTATLYDLLQEEVTRINGTGTCYVGIHMPEPVIFSNQNRNIIFRLLQEFIQNSLKHADCRKINISIEKDEHNTYITAKDDGKGFNSNQPISGIGLQTMRQRAQQLNALFKFDTQPGKGTCLQLTLHNNEV